MNGTGKIVILTGKSGAGKDSVIKELAENGFETQSFVSTTTRPMREGEQEGVDYNFVSKEEFLKRAEAGNFIEYRSYDTKVNGQADTWYYGSPKRELDKDKDYAIVLDMQGAKDFVNYYGKENCFVTYIDVSDQIREERASKRGSFDKQEWDRRLADDNVKFSNDIVDSIANFKTENSFSIDDTTTDIILAFEEYTKSIEKNKGAELIVVSSLDYHYNEPSETVYNVYDRQDYRNYINERGAESMNKAITNDNEIKEFLGEDLYNKFITMDVIGNTVLDKITKIEEAENGLKVSFTQSFGGDFSDELYQDLTFECAGKTDLIPAFTKFVEDYSSDEHHNISLINALGHRSDKVNGLPYVPDMCYVNNLKLDKSELRILSDMGYDVQSYNINDVIHNLLSDMKKEQQKMAELDNEISAHSNDDITIVGIKKEDGKCYALYMDGNAMTNSFEQAVITNDGSQISAHNHIFNNEELNLYLATLYGNVIENYIDDNNKLYCIVQQDSKYAINSGDELYEGFNTFSDAVNDLTIITNGLQRVDIENNTTAPVITQMDFEEALNENLKRETDNRMTISVTSSAYDDVIYSQTLLDCFNNYTSDHTSGSLESYVSDAIYDMYLEYIASEEVMLADKILENLSAEYTPFINDTKNLASEDILNMAGYNGVDIDVKSFLNRDFYLNVQFATPAEKNYDLSAIMGAYNIEDIPQSFFDNQERFESLNDNALAYLIHQQGHTVEELYNAMANLSEYNNDTFIGSVAHEINDTYYSQAQLTALVKLEGYNTLQTLENIAQNIGSLELAENTTIGLYDREQGAESSFEIKLEQKAYIPTSMIENIQLEAAPFPKEDKVKGNRGYTLEYVSSLYTSSRVNEDVSKPALIEENINETRLNVKESLMTKDEPKKNKTNIELD